MSTALAWAGGVAITGIALGLGYCWVVNRQLTAAEHLSAGQR